MRGSGYSLFSGGDPDQFEDVLLESGGLSQLIEALGGVSELHAVLGEGAEVVEEGLEAVNRPVLGGALGSFLVPGGL